MREIEFRAKNFKGEWVIGGCWCFYNVIDQENKAFIIEDGFCKQKVKPETVGQYTGLNDNNGTKIFEGDIVKTYNGTHKVVFSNQFALFGLIEICKENSEKEFDYRFTDSMQEDIEVIGNIYDNPELLEVE